MRNAADGAGPIVTRRRRYSDSHQDFCNDLKTNLLSNGHRIASNYGAALYDEGTMKLLERDFRTQYRLLQADSSIRHLLLGYSLDRLAVWALTVTLSIHVYHSMDSISAVAWLLLAYIVARAALVWNLPGRFASRPSLAGMVSIVRLIAVGSLLAPIVIDDLEWTLVAFTIVAASTGVLERSFVGVASSLGEFERMPALNASTRTVEQFCAFAGPLLAGTLLLLASERAAVGAVAALLCASAFIGFRSLATDRKNRGVVATPLPFQRSFLDQIRLSDTVRIVALGLLSVASIGVLLRVTLIDVVINDFDFDGGYYGLVFALIGVGALFGPLPVDKLLGHLSVEFVFTGGVLSLAAGAIVAAVAGHSFLVVPVLLGSGLIVVTLDLVASVTLRRLVPTDELKLVDRVFLRCVLIGQVASLAVVLAVSSLWSVEAAVVAVSGLTGMVMIGLFVAGGRTLTAWQMVAASGSTADARRETTR